MYLFIENQNCKSKAGGNIPMRYLTVRMCNVGPAAVCIRIHLGALPYTQVLSLVLRIAQSFQGSSCRYALRPNIELGTLSHLTRRSEISIPTPIRIKYDIP